MHTNTNTVTQLSWVCSCGSTGQWSNRSEDAVRSRWVDHSVYRCPTSHDSRLVSISSRILPGPCAHGRYAECIDCDAATTDATEHTTETYASGTVVPFTDSDNRYPARRYSDGRITVAVGWVDYVTGEAVYTDTHGLGTERVAASWVADSDPFTHPAEIVATPTSHDTATHSDGIYHRADCTCGWQSQRLASYVAVASAARSHRRDADNV